MKDESGGIKSELQTIAETAVRIDRLLTEAKDMAINRLVPYGRSHNRHFQCDLQQLADQRKCREYQLPYQAMVKTLPKSSAYTNASIAVLNLEAEALARERLVADKQSFHNRTSQGTAQVPGRYHCD